MALTLRLIKGSPLTHQELDDNFRHLTGSIVALEAATGSYVYSGSFDGSSTLTLYSGDTNYSIDLSALSGGGGSIDTGSFYLSSSVNLNTITFTQGDGTTESVTVDTGSGGGGDSNLVLELISNQTVGGVTSGDTFDAGDSIESVLRSILITYIEPVLSSFLIKLNGSTVSTAARDVGNSFTMNTASFSATVDDPNGNFPVSASVTASGADIGLQEIYLSDSLSSANNLGLGSTLTINRASTAGTVTFRVNTESETTADTQTITTSVPFYWRNYLAASTTVIANNNDATNVVDFETVDSTLDTNRSWTATCDSNNAQGSKYTYIIYPASYGDLSAVTQNGSLPVLTAFTKQTDRTVSNGYLAQTTFRIYKSNQPGAFADGVELTIS